MPCVATTFEWPENVWILLLQCVFTGRASLLVINNLSKCYDVVKAAFLWAYELVPEAYRQRFRGCRKGEKQTFVEFAREKEFLFDRWCTSQKMKKNRATSLVDAPGGAQKFCS